VSELFEFEFAVDVVTVFEKRLRLKYQLKNIDLLRITYKSTFVAASALLANLMPVEVFAQAGDERVRLDVLRSRRVSSRSSRTRRA